VERPVAVFGCKPNVLDTKWHKIPTIDNLTIQVAIPKIKLLLLHN